MTMPTVTVEVALTTDPGDASPVWEDLSDRFIRFTSHRGRRDELQQFDPGRLQVTLANEDRALDPTYSSSPYYPDVVPMRRIRIQATWSAVTYDVFNGYVDDWRQEYMPPQGAVCVVSATDAFKVLANSLTLSSPYASEVDLDSPDLWFRLGESAPPAFDYVSGVVSMDAVGDPQWGVDSLIEGDPDAAIDFPSSSDGLIGVFDEGTFPFTTSGTVSWFYRTDGTAGGNPPVLAIATIPGGVMRGFQASLDTFTDPGELSVVLVDDAGNTFNVVTSGVNLNDGATHHIVVTWDSGSPIKIYIDGVDKTWGLLPFSGTMANTTDKWIVSANAFEVPAPLTPGGPTEFLGTPSTFDEVAIWSTDLSSARVEAHYAAAVDPWEGDTSGERVERILDSVDWPAADRDIETGVSVLQPAVMGGPALQELQKIEETEAGALFVTAGGKVRFLGRDTVLQSPYDTSQATFGDSGAELDYATLSYRYDDQLIVNEAFVTREGGVTRIVRDQASQTRYMRRSRTISGLLFRYDSDAQDRAAWMIDHYKDPLLRATDMALEPTAGNEATHFPHVLGRELMDRVTVKRRPQNLGSAIDQQTLIQGIEHEVSAMEWRTRWNLSPAETQTTYWLAGVAGYSEAGVTTIAGY